jgi:glucokinase
MIAVVDIGGTKIATGVVVVDESGKLHVHERSEVPTLPERGFAHAVERIACMLHEAAKGAKLEGIAIGSTGPIDRETGVFGQVDTLPGWKGESLTKALRHALGDSGGSNNLPIVIENDADAAALGEATFGSGRGCKRFIYVTISTGIGGGIVIDGEIYRGAGGVHPEIGHHMIEASGPACSCGGRGCWEILASGPAMVSWAHAHALEIKGQDDLTAEAICRRAADGEPWTRAIIEREAFYLGVGLTNLIAMFGPDVIALGGGVMNSAHLFLDRAREVIERSATLVPSTTTTIATATLGGDAGLLGAAQAFRMDEEREVK